MKRVVLVAAVGYGDNGIGVKGRLPWHLPADLKHFRKVTMGHDCIVGHNTWLKMPYLDGRKVLIAPRDLNQLPNVIDACSDPVMIIGGAKLYHAAMPYATHMHLTRVGIQLPPGTCDAFFPDFNWNEWDIINQEFPEDDHRLSFMYLGRKS